MPHERSKVEVLKLPKSVRSLWPDGDLPDWLLDGTRLFEDHACITDRFGTEWGLHSFFWGGGLVGFEWGAVVKTALEKTNLMYFWRL